MKEGLEALYRLQEVDKELASFRAQAEAIPLALAEAKRKQEEAAALVREGEERQEEIHKQRKRLELEVGAQQEALDRFQQQLLSLKTNREYTAMLEDIAQAKRVKSDLEDKVLELLEKEDEGDASLGEAKANLARVREEVAQETAELEKELQRLNGRIAELEELRSSKGSAVPPKLRGLYERLLPIRGGLGLSLLEVHEGHGICSACKGTLPPQFAIEVRRNDDIRLCQTCGRILYWRK